jgi:environmental stress-induced protein Ves
VKTDGGSPGVDGGSDAGADSGNVDPIPEKYSVGGTVTGLSGTGLVLQNSGGDNITVNANGTFAFPTKLAKGAAFAVTVKNQPTAPSQTCSVSAGTGTVQSANVNNVVVNCATDKFTVGGTVSGLKGTGLVLQNNAGDNVTVNADGTFAFPTTLTSAAAYAVTVKTQPSNLSQTCTVTNGTGNVTSANITNVAVACVTNKFTVGGTVSGLVGTGLVLQNNGAGDLSVAADGSFTFSGSQDDGSDFAVTVKTDPANPTQACTVTGGSGKVAGGNVGSVTVNCSTKKYAIGGTTTGLDGTGLVLQNNAGDDIPVNVDGSFAFPTPIEDLAAYSVSIKSQPTNKWQTCVVSNGSGNVAAAAVTSVSVTCTTNTYKVSGSVSGLAGSGLVLQNNAGDDIPIAADGSFEFATSVASGSAYSVSVLTNPSNKSQTCTVTNGAGTIAGSDVSTVSVACVTNKYSVGGTVVGLAPGNDVVLQNNAGDDLTVAADGSFTFFAPLESGQSYTVTVKTNPTTPNQTCVVTGDTGSVVAGNVTTVQVNCAVDKYTAGGSVSGLEGTGLVLQNNMGDDIPVNANGTFSFTPQNDGTGYSVTVKTQPSSKSQNCVVLDGTGTIAGANVTNVSVGCFTNKFKVGGSVSGLTAGTVVLTNNGGDDLPITSDGPFTFTTSIDSGSAYQVVVKTQPGGNLYCSVQSGTGNVTNGDITNVNVTCGQGTTVTTVCGKSNPSGIFCGGNCTANHDEYAKWYCQLAGYTGAASFSVLQSGGVTCLYYNHWQNPVLNQCSQVNGPTGYGLASYCDAVTNLKCY